MKNDTSYLIDIVHYATLAQRFVGTMTKDEFDNSELVQLATRKALEIIGEAANKLTPEFRIRNAGPEWARMIAVGDQKLIETLVRVTERFLTIDGDTDLYSRGLSAAERAIIALHQCGLAQMVGGCLTANWTEEGRRLLRNSN